MLNRHSFLYQKARDIFNLFHHAEAPGSFFQLQSNEVASLDEIKRGRSKLRLQSNSLRGIRSTSSLKNKHLRDGRTKAHNTINDALSMDENYKLSLGSWVNGNKWVPRSPVDNHFGVAVTRNIYGYSKTRNAKPSLHKMFSDVTCKGYAWRISKMEEIRNSSCPYHTCDSCVNCKSGKCIWMQVGSNRGCYNTDQLSTSFLNSNQQYSVQTLGQCQNCSVDQDTSSQWGYCKGCPSIQERIVECTSLVTSKVVDDDLCKADEKPIAARPCDDTKQNIIDEFTYTPWKEKRHWQYACHIPNNATKYPVDKKKCNAQCVRWCDARAFTNTFLPSGIDPVTTGYKVLTQNLKNMPCAKDLIGIY